MWSGSFIARSYRDRHARQADIRKVQGFRVEKDGTAASVEVVQDAALVEDAHEAIGHLPAENRLHPALIDLVLSARECQHAQIPVLDRHRRVEQRTHRVGYREQVTRGEAPQGLRTVRGYVIDGQRRAQ